jgi:alanine dehydrogenase
MKRGAVIVDVAVDQGGCVETIHETSHHDPVFKVHGVLHYGVGNIPGAVPHTSTRALTNATLPYLRELAVRGVVEASGRDEALRRGINVSNGAINNRAVAEALGSAFVPFQAA